jgi:hypothetical protein
LAAHTTFVSTDARLSTLIGQHSIGSQSTGSRIRVTFRRRPAPIFFLFEDLARSSHPAIAPALAFRR